MRRRWWLVAAVGAACGAVAAATIAYPYVGSGLYCEGLGRGCTPERLTDSALVAIVFGSAALATLAVAWWHDRRGRDWRTTLRIGAAATLVATGATVWSQLPRHPTAPGSLSDARERMDLILADGKAVAPQGTPLGDLLRELPLRGPEECSDAYGRPTGAQAMRWERFGQPVALSELHGTLTAAELNAWAERVRARGVEATVIEGSGDAISDRQLAIGTPGAPGGGSVRVRSSIHFAQLEVVAATGCHEG